VPQHDLGRGGAIDVPEDGRGLLANADPRRLVRLGEDEREMQMPFVGAFVGGGCEPLEEADALGERVRTDRLDPERRVWGGAHGSGF
jgi:hypothetical protein